jgi:hypothetical protein
VVSVNFLGIGFGAKAAHLSKWYLRLLSCYFVLINYPKAKGKIQLRY